MIASSPFSQSNLIAIATLRKGVSNMKCRSVSLVVLLAVVLAIASAILALIEVFTSAKLDSLVTVTGQASAALLVIREIRSRI